MPPYTFATVRGGVLCREVETMRRPYVPKGSCVHISMTTTMTTMAETEEETEATPLRPICQLGVTRRFKSGSEASKNNNDNNNESKCASGDLTSNDNNITPVALMGLITTDSREGTRLTRRTAIVDDDDYILWESTILPSAQRIGCIQLDQESHAAMLHAGTEAAVLPSPLLYVADTVGNVYAATLPDDSVAKNTDEVPTKRLRHEAYNETPFWRLITSAFTSTGCCTPGARGWCGLATLPSKQLVCCREFFFDLRLLDVFVGSVVRRYSTTHPATGMTTCAGLPHSVVVAEGHLATVYDVRCSGTALTLRKENKEDFPLVTSRLTSPIAGVADVCATSKEYEVAVAVGRSLCVHDVRKWNSVSVSTNVLKYEIGSIAPFAAGKAVVAAGIDAEVRIIPLQSAAATSSAAANNGGGGGDGNGHKCAEREDEPAVMSFRKRIDTTVSCRSTWNGGWVESVDGMCASGISADYEIFLSF